MPGTSAAPSREQEKRHKAVAKHETWVLRQELKGRKARELARRRKETPTLLLSLKTRRTIRTAGITVVAGVAVLAVALTVLKLGGVTLDWDLVLAFLRVIVGWPLVVLALGVILRREVAGLLGRLAELKWGDKVASFVPPDVREDVSQAKEEADAVFEEDASRNRAPDSKTPPAGAGPSSPTQPPGSTNPSGSRGQEPAQLPTLAIGSTPPPRISSEDVSDLLHQAEYDPSGAVLRAYEMLQDLAVSSLKTSEPMRATSNPARVTAIVHGATRRGWLGPSWASAFSDVRRLRNEVAHATHRVTASDASAYVRLCLDLQRGLEAAIIRRTREDQDSQREEVLERPLE